MPVVNSTICIACRLWRQSRQRQPVGIGSIGVSPTSVIVAGTDAGRRAQAPEARQFTYPGPQMSLSAEPLQPCLQAAPAQKTTTSPKALAAQDAEK